ncbi:Upstream activation factor subunit spp27 [Amphibalanus amphitrite]|uniref:Upstream activation factor subunit spp27 n=1 Tax=Amphibalanus amphitrite TaxID=1232801 RepID=A0A6A4X0W0_AMPAM|nr:upstream activation factor subunit spp27-like [Amphibalanus amphitrite]XP_043224409.1 upstream activation factor subunit spp27-like [Amphibalanus amphitrite]XP_043224410.1 upstream activation factor subunit spp27-like [Amphibalanus amphitrite]KAF0312855.1 Upstream activation factor subunit spp27 [Amphibalanus amphitrite]
MASITKEELRAEIVAQLDDADLASVSAKKVRQALEKKFDEDLTDRKKEIDDLINEVLAEKNSGGEEEEEEEEEEEKPAPKKRKAAPKKDASDSEGEPSDDDDDEEYAPKKKRGAPKKRAKKSDSDEEDWRASKKAPKKAGGAKKGGTGYTKKCKLSEPLAKLMGEDRMARHEVIKKMWALIKENNMYDPKNKQYAICDDAMLSVIGVKRFRTFGMMKYLKDHFTNE